MCDGIQEAEEAFQTGDFELACLLDDFFELLPRGVMAEEGGVDDATSGDAGGDAFLKGLSEVSAADEGGEAGEEFADIHAGAVKVGQTLQKDGTGEAKATKEQPYKRATFGDELQRAGGDAKVNHRCE